MRLLKRYVANDSIIGAQSGSDRVLAAAGRGHGAAPVRDAVRITVGCGFRRSVDFIVRPGWPGRRAPTRAAPRVAAPPARAE